MRPLPSLFVVATRPCRASTSYTRSFLPRYIPHQPPLVRHASDWTSGLTSWLQNRLAIREDANRKMEEIERKRARERAAEQGEGSIFDTEAQEQLKREHEEEAEILELEEVPSQQWVGQAKRVDNRPKQGKMITVGQETHVAKRQKIREQTGKTAMFKISHRKLNKLAHQIGGKPIDQAILQMQFSEKRASTRIKSMLVLARDQGGRRGMLRERLVVAEAWVNKGPKLRRLDIKGRGRLGIKHHPSARMHIVLKEGKTWQEKKDDKFKKLVKAVRSAGLYREDVPIRNHGPRYTW